MADKWDKKSAELLPCEFSHSCTGGGSHSKTCPAFYRPAVAAELCRMAEEVERWKEDARRYSDNASFWCKKAAGM